MKTFTFSKKDLDYLQPVDANMNALNVAIQVYVVNQVFKRLALPPTSRARYDLSKGELYVEDEPKETPVSVGGEVKDVPPVAPPVEPTPAPEIKK
jgi:hypothetical protein